MTRAILTCFHSYTPYGQEFYEPLLDFYLQQMRKYQDEYDMLYLIEDDNWRLDPAKLEGMRAKIVHVDSSLRYYDAYKAVLPQVEEDSVLLLDDDMTIYTPKKIGLAFKILSEWTQDVVTITDNIGTFETHKLAGNNKFCPYFFAARKELLLKYLDVGWAPDMPYCETLGHLTEAMLKDDVRVMIYPEDKSNILFDGTQDGDKSKGLGYYHIRAGSTPAYLLATKTYGDIETYKSYLKNQPRSEYLRQFAWYYYILLETNSTIGLAGFLEDVGISLTDWFNYMNAFRKYHGLL